MERLTNREKNQRADEALAILRREGWTARDFFYAIKDGAPQTKRLVWDAEGSAEALVAAVLKEKKADLLRFIGSDRHQWADAQAVADYIRTTPLTRDEAGFFDRLLSAAREHEAND